MVDARDLKSCERKFVRVRIPLSAPLTQQLKIAGWSSLEARRAHNPKVAGSNPAPAIFLCNEKCTDKNIEVKNMLACFLTDIFLDVYGECRKRKTAGLELSTSD